jgi:hypothetical protein
MRLEIPSKWLFLLAVISTVIAGPPSASAGSSLALRESA